MCRMVGVGVGGGDPACAGGSPSLRSLPPRPFSPLESRAPFLVAAGSSVTRSLVGVETSSVCRRPVCHLLF